MRIDFSGNSAGHFWHCWRSYVFCRGFAQTGNSSLSGQVTDPSGAAIPGATVTLTGPDHSTRTAQTDEQGRYSIKGLAPGAYSVAISTMGFATFSKGDVQVAKGHPQVVNAQLTLTMENSR